MTVHALHARRTRDEDQGRLGKIGRVGWPLKRLSTAPQRVGFGKLVVEMIVEADLQQRLGVAPGAGRSQQSRRDEFCLLDRLVGLPA